MICLDHKGTTTALPEVREAILPYLAGEWGNHSSSYRVGSMLKSKIETAREEVANLIACQTQREILFTSGGTESNNPKFRDENHSRPTGDRLPGGSTQG